MAVKSKKITKIRGKTQEIESKREVRGKERWLVKVVKGLLKARRGETSYDVGRMSQP